MKKYELLEHTADVRVRVHGKTLELLFKHAAIALFDLLVNYKPKRKKTREISLEAETLEELFVNWLNELISIFYAYKFLPSDYNIIIVDAEHRKTMHASVKGEFFNPYDNKKINQEIKAATYHNLKIEKDKKGYRAEIIFDV
ncbi:MAG: archease [Candidatus Omnitrophota bacterium]